MKVSWNSSNFSVFHIVGCIPNAFLSCLHDLSLSLSLSLSHTHTHTQTHTHIHKHRERERERETHTHTHTRTHTKIYIYIYIYWWVDNFQSASLIYLLIHCSFLSIFHLQRCMPGCPQQLDKKTVRQTIYGLSAVKKRIISSWFFYHQSLTQ